jgi:hypothetical protein
MVDWVAARIRRPVISSNKGLLFARRCGSRNGDRNGYKLSSALDNPRVFCTAGVSVYNLDTDHDYSISFDRPLWAINRSRRKTTQMPDSVNILTNCCSVAPLPGTILSSAMFFPDRLSKMFHDLIVHRRRITSCSASGTLNQSLSLSIPRSDRSASDRARRPGNRITI